MYDIILLMGNFRRDNRDSRGGAGRGGGGRFFGGGGGGFGRSDDRPREMFKTTCSNCGKDCEVPFRPTSGKPVYCSDCFEKMGGRSPSSDRPERSDRSNFRPQAPRVDDSKQFSDLNAKLDKIIALLTPKAEGPELAERVETPVVEEIEKVKVVKTPKVKKVLKK